MPRRSCGTRRRLDGTTPARGTRPHRRLDRVRRSGRSGSCAATPHAWPAVRSPSARWYRRDDAHPAPLHHRRDRPVALRPRRGGPRPDPDHARARQAQGDRQGHPAPDVAARRQPRAVRRADASALARGRTFDVVTQVSVGHAWLHLRDSLESAATAWYLAELADRSLEERHAAEPLYALLRRAYELLDAGMAPGRVARWYEMHLADELGAAARGGPLRRVRPGPRGRRARSAGCRRSAASCASAVPGRRTSGRGSRSRRSSCSRPTSASTSRRSPRSASARPSSARSRPRCATFVARRAGARRALAAVPRRGPDGAGRRPAGSVSAPDGGRGGRAGFAVAAGRRRRWGDLARGGRRAGRSAARRPDRGRLCVTTPSPPTCRGLGASPRAPRDAVVADLHADSLLLGPRPAQSRATRGHVDVPRLIEGNVALQVFAVATQVAAPPEHRAQRRPVRDDVILARPRPRLAAARRGASLLARALHLASRRTATAAQLGGPLRSSSDRRPTWPRTRPPDRATDRSTAGSSPSRAPTRSTATRPTSRSSPTPASG